MDHVAYLSQEIGPRPAGTEEEQQAALYIIERLQKDAHLSANIEDFTCNSNPLMPKIICCALALAAIVLGLALPAAAIPATIVALIAAALHGVETLLDRPLLSQAFTKGVSQNVVAKYEPTHASDGSGARRRKVIVVANYDSGKVRRDASRAFARFIAPLNYAALGGMALGAVLVLVRQLAFSGGTASVVAAALAGICCLFPLALLVFALLEKFGQFTEGANGNAAGVAVMLEVARRLGNGEVKADVPVREGVMHDEESARAAGVVPDGATVSYENESGEPLEGAAGLAAAKAAIAAMTGEPVRNRVNDISANLVQVKDAPLQDPDPDALSRQRLDTQAALSGVPADTIAAAAAKVQESQEGGVAEGVAAGEAESAPAPVEAAASAAAAQPAPAAKPSVPDWYKKATEKARSKAERDAATEAEDEGKYRSRFADYPSGNAAEPVEAPVAAADENVRQEADASDGAKAGAPAGLEEAPAQRDEQAPAASHRPNSAEASRAEAMPGATTAMPPVSAGSLDLDALRAAAGSAPSAGNDAPGEPIAVAAEDASAEPLTPAAASAAVANASAETTRLPQMMYYTPPAPRDDVIRERAQKSRVTVSATAAEEVEIAVSEHVAAAEVPTSHAAPAGQAGPTLQANIPVVDLPPIQLPPIVAPEPKPVSFDELKQRAPLANAAAADGKAAAKSPLASSLPSISPAAPQRPSAGEARPQVMGQGAFEVEPQRSKNANVSLTGSFSAIGAVGSIPVGDELLRDIDPDDIYVDDADDSVFEEEFTETGAPAGPGYVDMPKSRVGKFFGRFHRKKDKRDESSVHEWLGVDDDFDARSVGKARGGWESFRDDDDWQGGAFSSLRARMGRGEGSAESDGAGAYGEASDAANGQAETQEHRHEHRSPFDGVPLSGDVSSAAEEIQQIYSFASGDINTEVWFVGLGSELAGNGGTKAFLAEHASEMRGAVVVNLESLGGGALSYLEREGFLKQASCSARMKRFVKKASQASGLAVHPASIDWKESPASYAAKHRMQAMTLVGMDGPVPARFAQADDVIENIDAESLDAAADFVVELLKNI